jgi:hypothetical protein
MCPETIRRFVQVHANESVFRVIIVFPLKIFGNPLLLFAMQYAKKTAVFIAY